MDLSGKTLDQLRSEFVVMGDELSVLAAKRKEYSEEINRRIGRAAISARVDLMDREQKDALLVILKGEDPLSAPAGGGR